MRTEFGTGAVIVAGGSGGFGTAICRRFAEGGSDVALTYRSAAERAAAVVAEIEGLGRRAVSTGVDLRDEQAVASFVATTAEAFGGIHTVVYASGPMLPFKFLSQVAPSELAEFLDGDTRAFFNLVHAAVPHLRRSKGSLVAIHTVGLQRWPIKDGLSVVPKAGVAAIITGIAREEARYGIRANSVAPGVIETGQFEKMQANGQIDDKYLAATKAMVPLGRLGQAEDVADAVAYLASQRAGYVTGQVIAVDGGFRL